MRNVFRITVASFLTARVAADPQPPLQSHWAFESPRKSIPPKTLASSWCRNPIDSFILHRLEQEGLQPAPEASHNRLLRRLALHLTGLPPNPDLVARVKSDSRPSMDDRFIDAWMSSRAYAERQAQDWLDLARYADSNGYSDDQTRAIWPYREWVIQAFARNQPFDQFTIEQLAGDLLPAATLDQRIATAFHRNAPQAKGNTYPVEEYRIKGVVDRVNTTGTVWLGLTLACAECHDHKFDPISQRDYYSVFALFNNIVHTGEAFAQDGPSIPFPVRGTPKVPVMEELPTPRPTYIHRRGNFLDKGPQVQPGAPITFVPSNELQPTNRLQFAQWLVNGRNPLVARVVVNRLWQSCFGEGLVRTPADFGRQGAQPTHPELLDWLACELVENGWNLRAIHRLIVTSSTYRQSPHASAESRRRDPLNRLLSRSPRFRLPAEQLRDQALAVAGLLETDPASESVFPIQPNQYWEERALPGKWVDSAGADRHRRSLYTYWRRMALHPTLELLDAPARAVCIAKRTVSNVPTQALVTLNDPIFVEAAQAFATRLLSDPTAVNDTARIQRGFQRALARNAEPEELSRFLGFLQTQRAQSPSEHRAWASVASVLLNLDEFLCQP